MTATPTPNYNLDTDTTLGGNSASDLVIASQKAVKSYVDAHTVLYSGTGSNTDGSMTQAAITNATKFKIRKWN